MCCNVRYIVVSPAEAKNLNVPLGFVRQCACKGCAICDEVVAQHAAGELSPEAAVTHVKVHRLPNANATPLPTPVVLDDGRRPHHPLYEGIPGGSVYLPSELYRKRHGWK